MYMGHSFAVLFLAFAQPTDCRRRKDSLFNKGRRDELKFVHVSDVHYTPLYNKSVDESSWCQSSGASSTADYEAPYGRVGCDSPADLWLITLDGMKEKARDAKFLMITGIKLDCFFSVDHWELVMKPGKHQRSKQRRQDLCWKIRDSAQSFVLLSYIMHDYVTNTFLLVSSSVRSKQLLCFVQGSKPKKRTKTGTTKKFAGFHNHSALLTTVTPTYKKSVSHTLRCSVFQAFS